MGSLFYSVIREIHGMKVVIDNPQCGYATLVKIKLGFFKYKFESIISSINKFENKTTTKTSKKKKRRK